MIDCHCHLEQEDFDKDRDEVIRRCKEHLKAVIVSCAHPDDFEKTMEMCKRYENFVFATAGIHPEYVKEISEKQVEEFLDVLRKHKDRLVGIGEVGLDYWWIKEEEWRKKQRDLFMKFIELAKELKKPLVIHARDAFNDAVDMLESADAERVQMHMFGAHHLLKRVVENGWFVSLNTIVLRSKKHKKIARDIPLENLLIETDSPWLSPEGGRNTPLSVRIVIEKIAEIRKTSFEEIDEKTTANAIRLFGLNL
ncbi:MAG: hypothetical protein DRP15_02630 [Candidatus Aenigmatarchaeota archaeon]|nr:MAG: hypothetical protein DRP15_02630 [Candidatus Aenigmarchaeota archaeon]